MILVTGGSGYVGSHIARRLAKAGRSVRVMVRDRERAEREGRLHGIPVEWVEADVTDPATLAPTLDGATAVVHTVAIAIEKGRRTYEEINEQGTINVVEAARDARIRRFVHLSQLGADPDLRYRFLASKGRAAAYLTDTDLEWTILSPSVIWGPEDEFANTFAKLLPLTPLVFPIIGDESARFQPVWVEDVVTAVVKTLTDRSTIHVDFELGGPEVLTLEEIERRTLEAVGARRLMVRFPMSLLRIVAALMEVMLPAPPVTRSLLELLAVSNVPENNALPEFVAEPRAFTSSAVRPYMRDFRLRNTLAQFLGR